MIKSYCSDARIEMRLAFLMAHESRSGSQIIRNLIEKEYEQCQKRKR